MTLKVDVSYGGLFRLAVTVISVAMVIYHVWAIAFGSPEAFHYRGTHLLFAMTLVFLLYRSSGKAEGLPTPLDYLLLVLGAAPIFYLFMNYNYFIDRIFYVDELTWSDMIMGTVMTVLVLEGTRRVIGLALPNACKAYIHEGWIDSIVLWNTGDLGYLTVQVAHALGQGGIAPGTFQAGRLGAVKVEGSQVVLGAPFVFDKGNVDGFDF